jgi:hypothetical protein
MLETNINSSWKVLVGRVNPPEAQQTIAPITFFSNTEASQRRAHIPEYLLFMFFQKVASSSWIADM